MFKDQQLQSESIRDVMINVQDCNIEVSEFEPQSYYYVHFQTLGKGMNPLIILAMI